MPNSSATKTMTATARKGSTSVCGNGSAGRDSWNLTIHGLTINFGVDLSLTDQVETKHRKVEGGQIMKHKVDRIDSIDALSEAKDTLSFVNLGLTQNSSQWTDESIYGLSHILDKVYDLIVKAERGLRS